MPADSNAAGAPRNSGQTAEPTQSALNGCIAELALNSVLRAEGEDRKRERSWGCKKKQVLGHGDTGLGAWPESGRDSPVAGEWGVLGTQTRL